MYKTSEVSPGKLYQKLILTVWELIYTAIYDIMLVIQLTYHYTHTHITHTSVTDIPARHYSTVTLTDLKDSERGVRVPSPRSTTRKKFN